ncbi:DUF4149 domain-containing protein [Paraburkholderia sp. Ac-20347]|jgi:hypothetical protein|nr:DUF4149 domain-containing protein [Paraburkholderia sp. Ac-20347]
MGHDVKNDVSADIAASRQGGSLVPHRLFALIAMLWVGSQLTIGYAVAPVLFASLDHMSAGAIAAQVFRIEGMIGLVSGVVLLVLANVFVKRGEIGYRRLRWLLVGMLLCVVVGYYALQPFMNAMRMNAAQAGIDIAHSAYASRFGMLHGISSLFYLIESLLGAWLVWLLPSARGVRR